MCKDWQVYVVRVLPSAKRGLKKLRKKLGKSVFQQLREAILDLSQDPINKTQMLVGRLSRFRSLHVCRCRIIVHISETYVTVRVVAAGWREDRDRQDIYQQIQRAIDEGKIDPNAFEAPLDEDEEDSE